MPFQVDGLQFFGKLSLFSIGATLRSSITPIYNNCTTTFEGGYIVASPSTFPIQATDPLFNFEDYQYSITFTPYNLIQPNQLPTLIPYYLNQTLVASNLIQVSIADYQGNDFAPNDVDESIVYFINIRLT